MVAKPGYIRRDLNLSWRAKNDLCQLRTGMPTDTSKFPMMWNSKNLDSLQKKSHWHSQGHQHQVTPISWRVKGGSKLKFRLSHSQSTPTKPNQPWAICTSGSTTATCCSTTCTIGELYHIHQEIWESQAMSYNPRWSLIRLDLTISDPHLGLYDIAWPQFSDVKDLGPTSSYLGIQITRDRKKQIHLDRPTSIHWKCSKEVQTSRCKQHQNTTPCHPTLGEEWGDSIHWNQDSIPTNDWDTHLCHNQY